MRLALALAAAAAALVATASAIKTTVLDVAEYRINNGPYPNYYDELYVPGPVNSAGIALSGGTGELVDGVTGPAGYSIGSQTWSGWYRSDQTQDYIFASPVDVHEIRIHVMDASDVMPMPAITVSWDGPNAGSEDLVIPSYSTSTFVTRANRWLQLWKFDIREATTVTLSWEFTSWTSWGPFFSEVQFIERSLDEGQIVPASYDVANGYSTGTFTYFDDTYDGAGDKATIGAALTGGKGDLTDGLVAIEASSYTEFDVTGGAGPHVTWVPGTGGQSVPILFRFDGPKRITSITVHGATCPSGCAGTTAPARVVVTCPTTEQCEEQAVDHTPSGSGTFVVSLTGLDIFTDELTLTAVLPATSTSTSLSEIEFHGPPCEDVDAPSLQAAAIDGADLELSFASPSGATSQEWTFVGSPDACGSTLGAGNGWTVSSDSCNSLHTFRANLADTLAACNFARLPDAADADNFLYETTVQTRGAWPATDVFGEVTSRTVQASFTLRVAVPKSAQASASAAAYGSAITLALVSSQAVNPAAAGFEFGLVTSVQAPYELVAPATTSNQPAGFGGSDLVVTQLDSCPSGSGACTQRFTLAGTASACSLDGTAELTFTVKCRAAFGGSCDEPAPGQADVSFAYRAADFCAQVVEVAQVTPSMVTYSAPPPSGSASGGTPSVDFVLQTTLHARVSLEIEAGLAVTRVELRSLDLLTDSNVAVLADGAVLVAGAALDTTAQEDGNAWVDFSFALNTDTVKFSGAEATGQATLTATAVVAVTYAGAPSQKRSVRLLLAPGSSGQQSAAASTVVGVAAAPGGGAGAAGGSSASGASGSVLGVGAGTATVAAVGLVAVVALAAGAAVVARRRRASRAAASRLCKSSSAAGAALSLDVLPAATAPPATAAAVPALDLGAVQAGYAATDC